MIWNYNLVKCHLSPRKILIYEDSLQVPCPKRIVEHLKLPTEKFDETRVRLPVRQNTGDKLKLFIHPEKIVESYRESFLNQLWDYGSE